MEDISQIRAIVVDDMEILTLMLLKQLQEIGIAQIKRVKDGEEAISEIEKAYEEKTPFDLVLCDWNMPNKTGLEVLKHLRKKNEFKRLPFIMITSETEKRQIMLAKKNGITDYIAKPCSSEILKEKIERIFIV